MNHRICDFIQCSINQFYACRMNWCSAIVSEVLKLVPRSCLVCIIKLKFTHLFLYPLYNYDLYSAALDVKITSIGL